MFVSRALSTLLFLLPSVALSDGGLDPTFGDGGRVRSPLVLRDSYPRCLAHQPDGRIVAATSDPGRPEDLILLRYSSSGLPDPTFGAEGIAATRIGHWLEPSALAVQLDGKILVVGQASGFSPLTVRLMRFEPDGALDTSFGENGGISLTVQGLAYTSKLVLQPDGKVLVSGATGEPPFDVVLHRRLRDGRPDLTFGVDGKVVVGLGASYEAPSDVALLPDGRIVVAGITNATGTTGFLALRLAPNGALDSSFGVGGFAVIDFGDGARGGATNVVPLPDGKIVLGGISDLDLVLIRLTAEGHVDAGFGTASTGRVRIEVPGAASPPAGLARIGGRLLLSGSVSDSISGGDTDVLVVRTSLDGVLDSSFGSGGLLRASFGDATLEGATAASVSPDGRLVVAGHLNLDPITFSPVFFRFGEPCLAGFRVAAPASTCPGSVAVAKVLGGVPDATYAWTIQNGTLLSGQGTPTVKYAAGTTGSVSLAVTVTTGECEANGSAATFIDTLGCTAALGFHTLVPCRVVDTRSADSPPLPASRSRRFPVAGRCGVPGDARAVAANVTALNASTSGNLSVFAEGLPSLPTSVNAYRPGEARATFAQLALGENGAIRVESTQHTGSADVLVDVSGYYK